MPAGHSGTRGFLHRFRVDLLVLLVSCCIFLPLVVSPPHLMDDVDAVQAQIARNMLQSGDWVTARLDGIAYLEKSPLIYWIMAASFRIFGVHDWAARLPLAFINIALCWITARFAVWAFGRRAGIYSGTILATCIGIFLFTRILIPDAALTLTVVLALWSFLRLLDSSEPRRTTWFLALYTSLACGLLLKGLIAAVFPIAIAAIYLLITREASVRELAKRLRPFSGLALVLLIAAPRRTSTGRCTAAPASITASSGFTSSTSTSSASSTSVIPATTIPSRDSGSGSCTSSGSFPGA